MAKKSGGCVKRKQPIAPLPPDKKKPKTKPVLDSMKNRKDREDKGLGG